MAFSSSVPVRYWRIGWGRSVSDTNSYAFEIATLQLYDSSDTHLTASGVATPHTITLSGSSTDAYDLLTYPLSNLTDENETFPLLQSEAAHELPRVDFRCSSNIQQYKLFTTNKTHVPL